MKRYRLFLHGCRLGKMRGEGLKQKKFVLTTVIFTISIIILRMIAFFMIIHTSQALLAHEAINQESIRTQKEIAQLLVMIARYLSCVVMLFGGSYLCAKNINIVYYCLSLCFFWGIQYLFFFGMEKLYGDLGSVTSSCYNIFFDLVYVGWTRVCILIPVIIWIVKKSINLIKSRTCFLPKK